jgi:hypothetical protein
LLDVAGQAGKLGAREIADGESFQLGSTRAIRQVHGSTPRTNPVSRCVSGDAIARELFATLVAETRNHYRWWCEFWLPRGSGIECEHDPRRRNGIERA